MMKNIQAESASLLRMSRYRPLVIAFLLLVFICSPLAADDRNLLRQAVGSPYVFLLFDTSGSMHWSPQCTQEDFDRADGDPEKCDFLCPTGDCFVPRNGDDPSSKLYQAKSALFEVLKNVHDVNFGFATYNQDNLRVEDKHWLYRVSDDQPNGLAKLSDGSFFPPIGTEHNFGKRWNCTSGGEREGCDDDEDFSDIDDEWEINRLYRFPKLGRTGNEAEDMYFFDSNGTRYRYYVWGLNRASPSGQKMGNDTLDVLLKVEICDPARPWDDDCGDYRQNQIIFVDEVRFELIGDFVAWDIGARRNNPTQGFFSQSTSDDGPASNSCQGWDSNNDSSSDDYYDGSANYWTRWPTDTSDPRGSLFYKGDVVPLDWLNDNKVDILNRLAPSSNVSVIGDQDFGVASYFNDERIGSQRILKLKDESQRPIVAHGSTPIGNSMRDFRNWYSSWVVQAKANDIDWECRKKYLIVVTDGDNTCSGASPCTEATNLVSLPDNDFVNTYVVAFGVDDSSGNSLNCMAENGGTDAPIYPKNKQQLVDALAKIFGEIQEEARAFATAAVPAVQSEVTDKIFLSSFTPLNSRSFWDGHLDSYLKPLPLLADGRPDKTIKCSATRRSSCHLFDVGEVLVTQAPTADEANENTIFKLKLGSSESQRRVFYGLERTTDDVPGEMRLFGPSDDVWAISDLASGMGLIPPDPTDPIDIAAVKTRIDDVIQETLAIREAQVLDENGVPQPIKFVLGDVFHSDPTITDSPNNFSFTVQDLFNDDPNNTDCDSTLVKNRGYRCFAERQRWRRKMLIVGANDGQLHFFDSGYFDQDTTSSRDPFNWRYTDGTGKELFSYMPRLTLPVLRTQAEGTRHIYSADGNLSLDDVFIDPIHDGKPDPDDREWRSILIGGLREGGSIDGGGHLSEVDGFVSGYYALDITQPDRLTKYTYRRDTSLGTVDEVHFLPSEKVVPTCINADYNGSGLQEPASGCETLLGKDRPFPAEMWSFTDSITDDYYQYWLDEEDVDGDGALDGNGTPDLGDTWSQPIITRIQVCTDNCDPTEPDNDVEDRFVAIFGGGFDPYDKLVPQRGLFLYMVDVETGKTIYKRQVEGSIAAAPTVISDQFGIAETIYFGTTTGYIYKVDVSGIGKLETKSYDPRFFLPQPADPVDITRVYDEEWDPYPIFDADGRQIYQTINALRIEEVDGYGLTIGTGDREDLFTFDGVEGRFYFILDENMTRQDYLDGELPYDETDYEIVAPDSSERSEDADYLFSPDPGKQGGWVITLNEDERVIVQSFGLKGVVIFTTYEPDAVTTGTGTDAVCARTGATRAFAVFANNANGIREDRYATEGGFHGQPVVDAAATTNPDPQNSSPDSASLTEEDLELLEQLKKYFPKSCRFANYWLSVSATRDDTGQTEYLKVPICSIEGRWKELR